MGPDFDQWSVAGNSGLYPYLPVCGHFDSRTHTYPRDFDLVGPDFDQWIVAGNSMEQMMNGYGHNEGLTRPQWGGDIKRWLLLWQFSYMLFGIGQVSFAICSWIPAPEGGSPTNSDWWNGARRGIFSNAAHSIQPLGTVRARPDPKGWRLSGTEFGHRLGFDIGVFLIETHESKV